MTGSERYMQRREFSGLLGLRGVVLALEIEQ